MSKKAKKITFIILAVVLVLVIGIIVFLNYVFPKMFLDRLFPQEEFTESYDGKYGYLQLSSPKETICTLNLYTIESPNSSTYRQTLHTFYQNRDMRKIMWGINSYDLFFDTDEAIYVYRYDEKTKQWIGPLYFYVTGTEELRSQGIADVYSLESTGKKVESDFLPIPVEFYQIPKQTVPAHFVEEMERCLDINRKNKF